jgi:hypothetical protein
MTDSGVRLGKTVMDLLRFQMVGVWANYDRVMVGALWGTYGTL